MRHEAFEHVAAVAKIRVGGIGEVAVVIGLRALAAEDAERPIDASGPRLKDQRVDHREHGGVDADAERQDDDGDSRETRRPPQQSKRVAHIAEQRHTAAALSITWAGNPRFTRPSSQTSDFRLQTSDFSLHASDFYEPTLNGTEATVLR